MRRLPTGLAPSFFMATLFAVLLQMTAHARPLPAGEGESTDFNHRLGIKMDFDRRTMGGAYRRVGARHPDWNLMAESYLDDMVEFLAGVSTTNSLEMMLERGASIMAAGCTDPLVAYCHGRNLMVAGRVAEAEPLLRAAAAALLRSDYSVCRAYFASVRYSAALARLGRFEDLAEQEVVQLTLLMHSITEEDYSPVDERVVYMHLSSSVDRLRLSQVGQVVEALQRESKPVNPFLLQMILGDCARRQAAGIIQDGAELADLLPTERQAATDAIARARQHYRNAAAAMPSDVAAPEPHVGLLACALLAGPEPGQGFRALFDAAVAEEFDNSDAYTYMFASLAKRNDYRGILALAKECARTQRFDTAVPEIFVLQMLDLARLPGGPGYTIWETDADIWPMIHQVLSEVAKQRPPSAERFWSESLHAAIAYRFGHYDEAARILDVLGRQLTVQAFAEVHAAPISSVIAIVALTGPSKTALRRAANLESEGKLDAAAAIYREHLASAHQETARYALTRLRVLDWRRSYELGSTVSIDYDDHALGWQRLSRGWESTTTGLTLDMPITDATALVDLNTGNNVDVQAEVDLGSGFISAPLKAGIIIGHTAEAGPPRDLRCVIESKPFMHLAIYENGRPILRQAVARRPNHVIRAKLFGRNLSVWVNGQPEVLNLLTRNDPRVTQKQVGATLSAVDGVTYPRVRQLTVTRLENGRVSAANDLRDYRDALSVLNGRSLRGAYETLKPLASTSATPWIRDRAALAITGIRAVGETKMDEPVALTELFPGPNDWLAEGGGWAIDGGDIVCETRAGLSLLLAPFAGSELSVDVELQPNPDVQQVILLGYRDGAEPLVLTFDRGMFYFGWPGMPKRYAAQPVTGTGPIPVTIRQADGVVTVHSGDQFILGQSVSRALYGHVAFGAVGLEKKTVRFGKPRFTWHPRQ